MSGRIHVDPVPAEAAAQSGECPLISRRRFLQGMAAGAGALATAAAVDTGRPATAAASTGPVSEDAVGMLIDLTRCTGCNACALACKEVNGKPNADVVPTELNSGALSYVSEKSVSDEFGHIYSVFVKQQCMHCAHPACASACTVGALRKTAEGPVVYDAKKCIGCRYCQYACPFGVPAYEWDNPLGLISKCELCVTRLEEGQKPACVAACPNGAVRFGRRRMLLAEAHSQIKSNPGRYVNHVYGEHEVGGTSVLYLAPVPFSALGFPTVGDQVVSRHAEFVMRQTPLVAVTVAALATAIQFMTRRRGLHEQNEFVPVKTEQQGGAE